jgi:predicted transcriptional regulator
VGFHSPLLLLKKELQTVIEQPVISRMEAEATSPHLDTVIRVLAALGKTLYIGELKQQNGTL